jgi:hypothetical protein
MCFCSLAGEFATVERKLTQCRELANDNAQLITCAITPFGLDGPIAISRLPT